MKAQATRTSRAASGQLPAQPATTPRQVLAEQLAARLPACNLSWKFGGGSLDVDGKVFAFTRTNEGVAMKLPEDRIAALLESGSAANLVMGKRTMREWAVVEDGASPATLALLKEALRFVSSLPAEELKKKPKKSTATKTRRTAKP